MLLFWLLSVIALAQQILLGGLGQSNMLGYDDPYPCVLAPADPTCNDIPQGATYRRNGVVQTEFVDNFSGVEVGLLTCLVDLGYEPTFDVRAINGMAIRSMNTGQVPLLLQDFAADVGAGKPAPSAVIVIHGEQDSRTWSTASIYDKRLFGPAYETTGPRGYFSSTQNGWVVPKDESTFGQIREIYPLLPFIVTELRTRDNMDLAFGNIADGGYLHQGLVRDSQAKCEGDVSACFFLETGPQYPISLALDGSVITDLHYKAEGFWLLGWDLCVLVDTWLMQSYP